MKDYNRTLAMVSLTLSVYGKEGQAKVIQNCSYWPEAQGKPLASSEIAALLSTAGLECLCFVSPTDMVPPFIQAAADDGHIVLVGMQPNDFTPYISFGVLERHSKGCVRLVHFGDSSGEVYGTGPLADYLTGEYVIIRETLPESAFKKLRQRAGR